MAGDPLLIVDDDPFMRDLLTDGLIAHGYDITTAETGSEARAQIARRTFHIALLDLSLPDTDGMALVDHLFETAPETAVIIMTGYPSLQSAIEGLRRGAQDYLIKPFKMPEVIASVDRAVVHRQLRIEVQRLRERVDDLEAENARLKQAQAEEQAQAQPVRTTPTTLPGAYGAATRPPAQPTPGASGDAE